MLCLLAARLPRHRPALGVAPGRLDVLSQLRRGTTRDEDMVDNVLDLKHGTMFYTQHALRTEARICQGGDRSRDNTLHWNLAQGGAVLGTWRARRFETL